MLESDEMEYYFTGYTTIGDNDDAMSNKKSNKQ